LIQPELIEIHVGLSEYSSKTQMALFDIINDAHGLYTLSWVFHDFYMMKITILKRLFQMKILVS